MVDHLYTKANVCIDTKMTSHGAIAMMETTTNVDSPSSVLSQFSSLHELKSYTIIIIVSMVHKSSQNNVNGYPNAIHPIM